MTVTKSHGQVVKTASGKTTIDANGVEIDFFGLSSSLVNYPIIIIIIPQKVHSFMKEFV